MPNRIIKDSIWTSPNLNLLSDLAERHFYRILPLPDDFGCFESTPAVVKGRCYPLKDSVSPKDVRSWQDELEAAQLIVRWWVDNREYAIFPTFPKHQRLRALHQRKTPAPPDAITEKCGQILSHSEQPSLTAPDDARRQEPSSARLNPNPNRNPNRNLKGDYVPRAPSRSRGETPPKRTRRADSPQATASPGPTGEPGGHPETPSRGGGPGHVQLKLFQVEAGVFLDEVEQQEGMRLPRETLMPVVRKAMGLLGADGRASQGEVARQWYRWARQHDSWGRRVEPATLLRRMADKLPYWAKERAQGKADGGFDEDARKLARWGSRQPRAERDAPAPGGPPS